MPVFAFGTGTALYGKDAVAQVVQAIKAGFVHIDAAEGALASGPLPPFKGREGTRESSLPSLRCPLLSLCAAYANEETVGEAIRQSGVARDKLFITSKSNSDDARKSLMSSLKKVNRGDPAHLVPPS